MLRSFDEASKIIASGKCLHIAGTEALLKKLPKGNWIGGSTEYFMAESGGKVTNEKLFVLEFPFARFAIQSYDENNIGRIAADAFGLGFSVAILPFDSAVHKIYAEKAPEFEGIFMKNIVGWISGLNLNVAGQTPIAVNGMTGEVFTDKAVVAHISVPVGQTVNVGIINIFEQDESSPVIEFPSPGFSATKCLVDGKEVVFADYIAANKINTQLPIVGDYSGTGVNISFKAVENGVVNFYAPVFPGIRYRIAKTITNYEKEFNDHLSSFKDVQAVFACNCILNFLYGELENKQIHAFFGPITFGEIAYQLVNQTLVYVTVT
jgi:hypothetical protein